MPTVSQELAALRAQVAELTELVRTIVSKEACEEAFFAAGVSEGEKRARGALLGKAARTSSLRTRPGRGPHPGNLHAVRNDAG